ncbi:MAG: hypothetical protein OXF52_00840 [Candidatus Dadabacteria bacterium]|nr:hypothetical protein [Candidatus Dadabacteria bacterium]
MADNGSMVLRIAVFFLALVCASGFAGASLSPCPMPDEAAHAGHSDDGDCHGHSHKPQPDCDHSSFADCAGLQGATPFGKEGFETGAPAPPVAPRPVFLKAASLNPAAFRRTSAAYPRPGPVFLLTKHILI